MGKRARRTFNPKTEVSVMAWIEDDEDSVLLVRQAVGRRLWTLPAVKVKRNESLRTALRREVPEETGLTVAALSYRQMYDRPKRGAITILFRVTIKRQAARLVFPIQEIPDLGFFEQLPVAATPSARFLLEVRALVNKPG
jgi:ADP-ribose pyrophosphatase YjhB (NUDIX family)